jgi:Fcf1
MDFVSRLGDVYGSAGSQGRTCEATRDGFAGENKTKSAVCSVSIALFKTNASKVITQCCIVELYKMGKDRQAAVDLAKDFERRKCNHREAIEGSTCLREVVGAFFSNLRSTSLPRRHSFQVPVTNIVM